jgi:hypothetical protein
MVPRCQVTWITYVDRKMLWYSGFRIHSSLVEFWVLPELKVVRHILFGYVTDFVTSKIKNCMNGCITYTKVFPFYILYTFIDTETFHKLIISIMIT